MFGIDFSKFPDVFERILLPAIGETLYMSVGFDAFSVSHRSIARHLARPFRAGRPKAEQTAIYRA